jgi:hypothetical protein
VQKKKKFNLTTTKACKNIQNKMGGMLKGINGTWSLD